MKKLIKHILREETKDLRTGIIDVINKDGLFAGAKLVGKLDNLKRIFKGNEELIKRIENQRGEIYIPLHSLDEDLNKTMINSITLPFYIVDVYNNKWDTNSWGVINVVYDETLLTDNENRIFKEFLVDELVYETDPIVKINLSDEVKDRNYVTLKQINGKNINDVIVEIPYEEVSVIMDKLKNKTSINENRNKPLNYLMRRVSYDDLIKSIDNSISFVNEFRDREEMEGDVYERIVLDATMDDFHWDLSNGGSVNFDYNGIHNSLHQLFHDHIIDNYNSYNEINFN